MNKKIFTLAAALGLASVASTSVLAADLTAGEVDVTKFEVGKVYQLGATAAKVLVMAPDGANGYTLKLKAVADVTDLKSTLWKVTPTFNSHAAGPDFAFVNEATGLPLTADPAKAHVYDAAKTYLEADGQVKMSGSTSSWKWQAVTETTSPAVFGTNGLLSYFTKDSVVTLVTGDAPGTSSQSSDEVYLVKAAASGTWKANHLELAPITAGKVILSALDLNTKMLTDLKGSSFNLNADKTTSANSKLGNVFRDKTFRAWNMGDANWPSAPAENKANFIQYVSDPLKVGGSAGGDADHVFLQIIDKDVNNDNPMKDTYLLADTAYIDGTANNLALVKFGTDSIVSAVSAGNGFLDKAKAGRDIQSYMFKFTYYPTSDSIAISVKSYNKKKTTEAATPVNGKETKWSTAAPATSNVVTLNKLTEVTEITLTTADPAANVRFYLGAGNDNRSSEKNGLFYIQNGKGQYLSVPINEAGYSKAKWVTVKGGEQAVAHMPAYQWVVLKNMEQSATVKAISSLNVANREFPGVKEDALQLYKDAGATYKFAAATKLFAATDSLTFTQIEDEAVLSNATLGYLDLEDNVLKVMTYKLNYLHPYATNKFVGMDRDSLLSVKDAETAFFMKESDKANYGYDVTTAVANKIAGLKQLTRVKYTPYVKTASGNLYMAMNDESRYYLTHETGKTKTFYLKENNHYQPEGATEARHYYALIDLNSATDSTKVGTTDDDMAAILKNQVLHETRTSSFAVLPNDAPLYRRFNTALEGREADDEATVFLRFKELYRGEYLMDENNKSFKNEAVDYAGIERADKATGLSFMVDTAIVKGTPFGEIKPQYFIYVNKEVKDAVPAIACDATNHKHLDANGKETTADKCSHATPAKAGFVKAKYLVSFADSLSAKDAGKLYKFGKYTRVGFVDGLHIGDSLYILVNGFENKALADLDTADIKAAYKRAGITGKIIDLKAEHTDKHHNYTWSFRFISPEKAANVTGESKDVAFLIESKGDADIAPTKGAWLKSQNGCLVLSDAAEATFANAKTGGDNALIFNIEVGNDDELATDTETIAPSAVSVIASEGQVTIAGAEGKKVVVSNILGQTIANTVITSSTATIAVPAGVVVVAIEGEAAVKAIVK